MLDTGQHRALLDVLTKIEDGKIAIPRLHGDVGQFLREWGTAGERTRRIVEIGDTFVRGHALGPISLTPISPVSERLVNEMLGDVASLVAVAEELGTVVNVSLWGSARPANRLRNVWIRRPDAVVHLSGAFRWYAPRRVTPGSGVVEVLETDRAWAQARCLRFVGEEFYGPPIAASYRWDNAFGPPAFRTFRTVVLRRVGEHWGVVSGLHGKLVALPGLGWTTQQAGSLDPDAQMCSALVWRDPWNATWSVASAEEVSPDDALSHMVTWADYKRELLDQPSPPATEIGALRSSLAEVGINANIDAAVSTANLTRHVGRVARPLAGWLRGLG